MHEFTGPAILKTITLICRSQKYTELHQLRVMQEERTPSESVNRYELIGLIG